MRPRLFGILGAIAVAGLLAAPVALADPGQSSRFTVTGSLPDPCTGEYVDNTTDIHLVETATGPFHLNSHLVGVGETSGSTYVSEGVDNSIVHAAPDGTFTVDEIFNLHLVAQGSVSNAWATARLHFITDADGNVISGRMDFASGCQVG